MTFVQKFRLPLKKNKTCTKQNNTKFLADFLQKRLNFLVGYSLRIFKITSSDAKYLTYIQKLSPHLGKHVSRVVRNYVPNTQTSSPNFPYFGRIIVNNSDRWTILGHGWGMICFQIHIKTPPPIHTH